MSKPIKKAKGYNFWDDVYVASIKRCSPSFEWNTIQWRLTNRGTAILDTDSKCDIYNKYYAGRHYGVLSHQMRLLLDHPALFGKLAKNNINIAINDYGCGQGFATFALLEQMLSKRSKNKSINPILFK